MHRVREFAIAQEYEKGAYPSQEELTKWWIVQ